MKTCKPVFHRTALALAVTLAFPAGAALADEVRELVNPDTRAVSVTVEDLNAMSPLFRTYTGLNGSGTYGVLGLDIVERSTDGTWVSVQGRDLGKSGIQEASASVEKQGDWKLGVKYNENTKYFPYVVDTKVQGIGSGSVQLNSDFRSFSGLGPDTDLKLQRTATSLAGSKFLGQNLKFNFSFKTEDKKGAIMSAAEGDTLVGLTPINAGVPAAGKNYATQYFAPQPENYRHDQVAASVDYFTKKFQVSAGFYESLFTNHNTALNVTPGTDPSANQTYTLTNAVWGGGAVQVPWISLPPSNHSTQFYLQGAYNFSDATHVSLKVTSSRLVQDDSFIPATGATGLNPPGVIYGAGITNTNLGGLVDTTTYATRVTSRLTRDLDLMASWRYENRQDKTPIEPYVDGTLTNGQYSPTLNNGKIELGYRLPEGFRVSGGVDYDAKKNPPDAAVVSAEPGLAWREEVHESTLHLDLRKSMSETVNGSLSLAQGTRGGGSWDQPVAVTGGGTFPTATYVAAPLQFSDRKRDSARLMVDWSPGPRTSLQAYAQYSRDRYTSAPEGPMLTGYPLAGAMGLQSGTNTLFGLDFSYAINRHWKATAYFTDDQTKTHQNELQTPRLNGATQSCAGTGTTNNGGTGSITNGAITGNNYTCVPWTADLNMRGEALGAGLAGAVGRWDLGAKYMYSHDQTAYGIGYTDPGAFSPVPAGAGILPTTTYRVNQLRLMGTYAYTRQTSLRIDYILDQRRMDDYTWANWTFADGTRVLSSPGQQTQGFGVTVTHSF